AFTSQGVLFRMPARAGAEPTRLLGTAQGIGPFAISQAGRFVYTTRTLVDDNIWELKAGEPSPRRVLASTRADFSPQLSPDGSRIAFSSDRSGSVEIWVCDWGGANVTQLTTLGGASHSVRWSPDGK